MPEGTAAVRIITRGPSPSLRANMRIHPANLLNALTIFVSAFLLFQLEPLIAKIILPWFGGVVAVWTVCLLFFQVVVLLGYLYAHLLARRLTLRIRSEERRVGKE